MNNPYSAGLPDFYYSGDLADLWVEYKFIEIPKRDSTLIVPDLSELQRAWLNGRLSEGRDVYTVVGSKEGGYIFEQGMWNHGCTTNEFKAGLLDRRSLANWIKNQVLIQE